jgi:hypothetical protein
VSTVSAVLTALGGAATGLAASLAAAGGLLRRQPPSKNLRRSHGHPHRGLPIKVRLAAAFDELSHAI